MPKNASAQSAPQPQAQLTPQQQSQPRPQAQTQAQPQPQAHGAYLPQLDCWPKLSAQDREYRRIKLVEIERRLHQDGPHEAIPHPDRARQFMPFAALKGYHELAHSKENWEE